MVESAYHDWEIRVPIQNPRFCVKCYRVHRAGTKVIASHGRWLSREYDLVVTETHYPDGREFTAHEVPTLD